MEMWQKIRSLHTQGVSARGIARQLGVSRNTVHDAVAQDEPPHYERQGTAGSALEPHREIVAAGLRRGWRGSRLLPMVRKDGYTGSDSAFYEWLAGVKQENKATDAACRFETDPAQQAQFDWSTYRVLLGGVLTTVYVFALALGYSRRVHWFPSLAVTMDAIFEALAEAFAHFGGCCRFVVIDNPKALVIQHNKEALVWNGDFTQFCGHYRIEPIAATPRHARTKGKVENPFEHLHAHVIAGGGWEDFDAFWNAIRTFEPEWECRVHGTTKVRPVDRFEEERDLLIPLPTKPFPCLAHEFRSVRNDCLTSFGHVLYSVPHAYAKQRVRARLSQGRYVVFYSLAGTEIARHRKHPSGSPPVIDPAHYEGLRDRQCAALPMAVCRYRERYGASGETAEAFLQQLLAAHPHHPERAVESTLELLSGAPEGVAVSVLADAVALNLSRRDYLEELLRRRLRALPAPGRLASPAVPPPAQLLLPALSVERPLSEYGRALASTQERTR